MKEGRDIRDLKTEDFQDVDYVFHLAAQAKVPLSIDQPYYTHDHNVNGTLNVLLKAKEAGVKRVIYSASSSAYGDQPTLPLKETMVPNPLSPYAVQKLVGEQYCKVFSSIFKLETVSLRYFNVYGEDMPADNPYSAAIAIFLDKRKEGKPLPIFGGRQTRDFTYVGDVVQANILAMESHRVGYGEVLNIGSGQNYSITKIATTISKDVEYLPQRTGEPMDTRADISQAQRLLGWEPTVDVLEWLKQCVQ